MSANFEEFILYMDSLMEEQEGLLLDIDELKEKMEKATDEEYEILKKTLFFHYDSLFDSAMDISLLYQNLRD